MTRDEIREKCIRSIAIAATLTYDRATRAFDALNGVAFVVPLEATEESLKAGVTAFQHTHHGNDYLRDWNAFWQEVSAAGDLTNSSEKTP